MGGENTRNAPADSSREHGVDVFGVIVRGDDKGRRAHDTRFDERGVRRGAIGNAYKVIIRSRLAPRRVAVDHNDFTAVAAELLRNASPHATVRPDDIVLPHPREDPCAPPEREVRRQMPFGEVFDVGGGCLGECTDARDDQHRGEHPPRRG